MFMEERKAAGDAKEKMFRGDEQMAEKVESCYKEIQIEIRALWEQKQLQEAEERIAEEVRRKIKEEKERRGITDTPIVKRQGTDEVQSKLEQKVVKNTEAAEAQTEPVEEPEQVEIESTPVEDKKEKTKVDEQMDRLKQYLRKKP